MEGTAREKLELDKKKLSLKNMHFNRYLVIRYLTAAFFFINLNWLVLLLLANSRWLWVPLGLIVAILPAVWEQVKLYNQQKNVAPKTKFYFQLQLILNCIAGISIFTPLFQSLFPFMNPNIQGKLLILAVILTGVLLSLFVQYRLGKISTNHDRHYFRIQQYEKALHLGKESN